MAKDTPTPPPAPTSSGGTGRIILIVILAIALVGIGIFAYLQYGQNQELEQAKAEIEAEKQELIVELEQAGKELEAKIILVDSLGGDVAELLELKAQLETEKEQIRRNKDLQLRDLRDKVEGYEYLLKEKDKEIEKLQVMTENLMTENTSLKSTQNELQSTLSNLNEEKEQLQTKVEKASRLQAENITTKAINSRGREREGEFRPRHIDQIMVSFSLANNEVAPLGGRDILLRILDPQGNALFDVATGSGTFMKDGREVFYTAKQEIIFDNSGQALSFTYQKTKEFASGRYTVELYEGNESIGKSYFVVK